MNLDIIVLIALGIAVFKGISKGLVVALFSMVSTLLGLLIAFKFTAIVVTQPWLSDWKAYRWLPMLVFAALLIATMLLVHLAARFLEKVLELAMMGWLNKLGGVLFFALLYLVLISAFVWLAEKVQPAWKSKLEASATYTAIQPLAPTCFGWASAAWPGIRQAIDDLEKHLNPKEATPAGKAL